MCYISDFITYKKNRCSDVYDTVNTSQLITTQISSQMFNIFTNKISVTVFHNFPYRALVKNDRYKIKLLIFLPTSEPDALPNVTQ